MWRASTARAKPLPRAQPSEAGKARVAKIESIICKLFTTHATMPRSSADIRKEITKSQERSEAVMREHAQLMESIKKIQSVCGDAQKLISQAYECEGIAADCVYSIYCRRRELLEAIACEK